MGKWSRDRLFPGPHEEEEYTIKLSPESDPGQKSTFMWGVIEM